MRQSVIYNLHIYHNIRIGYTFKLTINERGNNDKQIE
jgi:hypothetical protein